MIFQRWLALVAVVASIGFTANAGRVAAQEPGGAGQPSSQIGLVKNDEPVTYVIGYPTDEQFDHLERVALKCRVTLAEFLSFPSLGAIELRPRNRVSRQAAQLM